MTYIVSTEGHDDDPDYDSYVLWATVCFLFAIFGLVLTYASCHFLKGVRWWQSGMSPLSAGPAIESRIWSRRMLRTSLLPSPENRGQIRTFVSIHQ